MEPNIINPLTPILNALGYACVEGRTGIDLDNIAVALIKILKYEPAFLGYNKFPNTICVSVNREVIHGIPSGRKFEEGDVVKIDCGIIYDGLYWDGARSVIIGKGSVAARKLVQTTKEALAAGIRAARLGNTTNDISEAIYQTVKREGLHIVEGFVGHGIGTELHMPPEVPNVPRGKDKAVKLEKGMRLAIEPMVCTKPGITQIAKDGFTVYLVNGGLASHFEETIEIL